MLQIAVLVAAAVYGLYKALGGTHEIANRNWNIVGATWSFYFQTFQN